MNRRLFLKGMMAAAAGLTVPKLLGKGAPTLNLRDLEDRVRSLSHRLDLHIMSVVATTNEGPPLLRVKFRVARERTDLFDRQGRWGQHFDDMKMAELINAHGFALNVFTDYLAYTQNWDHSPGLWRRPDDLRVYHPFVDIEGDFYDISNRVYEGPAVLASIGLEDVGVVRVSRFGPPVITLLRAEEFAGDCPICGYNDFSSQCKTLFDGREEVEPDDYHLATTYEKYLERRARYYSTREKELTWEETRDKQGKAARVMKALGLPDWAHDVICGMNDTIEDGYLVAVGKDPEIEITHEWSNHEVIGFLSGPGYLPIALTGYRQSYQSKIPGFRGPGRGGVNEQVLGWACPEQNQ